MNKIGLYLLSAVSFASYVSMTALQNHNAAGDFFMATMVFSAASLVVGHIDKRLGK